MASTNTTGLTQDQLDSIKKLIGPSGENRIDKMLSKLQQKYPDGYVTENDFVKKLDPKSSYKSLETPIVKRMFAVFDLDNSGTVDFYEFLMAFALVNQNDPQTKLKWLFSLCDSDRDGLVVQDDVVEVLTIWMILGSADPASAPPSEMKVQEKTSSAREECKELVEKTFGDKTQLTEEEFRQLFAATPADNCDDVARYFTGATLGSVL